MDLDYISQVTSPKDTVLHIQQEKSKVKLKLANSFEKKKTFTKELWNPNDYSYYTIAYSLQYNQKNFYMLYYAVHFNKLHWGDLY